MKQKWYSFCSTHQERNRDCELCKIGYYVPFWKVKVDKFLFNHFPKLWVWWVNNLSDKF